MDKKPNVILIYTDDYGYTDLGVFGIDKHVDTPIMDQLARWRSFNDRRLQFGLRSVCPHGPG